MADKFSDLLEGERWAAMCRDDGAHRLGN